MSFSFLEDVYKRQLVNLATAPEHRGKGYASRLVRHVLQLYRPRCRRMEVGTDSSTIPFYERFGFRYAYTLSLIHI